MKQYSIIFILFVIIESRMSSKTHKNTYKAQILDDSKNRI